jgi:uncharacterized membrane protein
LAGRALVIEAVMDAGGPGRSLVWNPVVWAYGASVIALALGAWLVEQCEELPEALRGALPGRKATAAFLQAGTAVAGFLLLTLEVRWGFQNGRLDGSGFDFTERAAYPMAWFAFGGMLLAMGYRFQSVVARRAGLTFAAAALAVALLICTLILNPLVTRDRVGSTPIFNGLMYAYGIPAVITGCLAWFLWHWAPKFGGTITERVLAWCNAIGSLVFIFALVTLEVQHCFRGDRMYFGASPAGTPAGEIAAYSIAWALLGFVYLIVGIMRRSVLLRAASLAMMLLVIPKIFLFDIVVTEDFQRVLSFTGVGVSLLALAFVYHRFVFRRPTLPEGAAEEHSDLAP